MIRFIIEGTTKNLDRFLDRMINGDLYSRLESHAQAGVEALARATPRETGETASAWSYEIVRDGDKYTIWWRNSNVESGSFNVAVGLQLGHGTGTGGWVSGIDYINPALRPIFDDIANGVWEEVQRA